MKRFLQRTSMAIGATVIIGIVAASFVIVFNPALFATILIEDNSADLAGHLVDAIVVLGGETGFSRISRGLALYKKGVAPEILMVLEEISGWEENGIWLPRQDVIRDFMKKNNAGDDVFKIIDSCSPATSTFEEATCLRQYFSRKSVPVKDLIVITSWSHTGRAARIFRHVFGVEGPLFYVLPALDKDSDFHHWWRHEGDVLTIYTEYLKSVYWLFKFAI